jgi:hypothetical protein
LNCAGSNPEGALIKDIWLFRNARALFSCC